MALLEDDPAQADLLRLVREQTALLLDAARSLDATAVRAPSRLPGWSRAHVLTHLARNAEALAGVLTAAAAGERAGMYPSQQARDADIETGAERSPAELIADLDSSAQTLQRAWGAYPADLLEAQFTAPAGWWRPVRDTPWFRCREVVLHHVDLATGFTLADAAAVATRLISETVELFAGRDGVPAMTLAATDLDRSWQVRDGGPLIAGTAPALAGWLTGRADGTDLAVEQPLPALPPWA